MSITWHGVTVHFAVGWTSSPSTDLTGTTWTDESAYVRSISVSRGRSDELGTFQPGTLTVVLDNRTRRFDPNYTAGALYGNLLPMRRARLRLNSVDVWGGFVDDIPQGYDISNKDATVTLRCTDGFAVLALSRLPESVYSLTIAADNPVAWYRLGETFGTIAADSSGNNKTGTYVGAPVTTTGLTFGGTDTAMSFPPQVTANDAVGWMSVPQPVTAFPISIECWFASSGTTGVVMWTMFAMHDNVRPDDVYINLGIAPNSDGRISTNANQDVSVNSVIGRQTVGRYDDGAPHHVVATFTTTTAAPDIYVDGVLDNGTASATGPVTFPANATTFIGTNYNFTLGQFTGPVAGSLTLDEVALYNTALSAGTILAHYNAGHAPQNGSTAGAQMGYILDQIGWSAVDRDIESGMHTMQSLDLAGQPALGLMQGLEKSEQGQLFMANNGIVVARNRVWRYDQTVAIVSQATFGDDGTGSELPYSDIQTDGGSAFLRNRVIVSRQGGGLVEATDPTSIGLFYERTDDELSELHNATDDDILYLAQWRVETRANPIPRVTVLEVRPRHPTTGLIAAMLALDIGYRVTVKRRPQNVGTALSYAMLVEGISHDLDADGTWIMRLYLSSFDSLSTVQPLVFDSATFGLFDTNVFAP